MRRQWTTSSLQQQAAKPAATSAPKELQPAARAQEGGTKPPPLFLYCFCNLLMSGRVAASSGRLVAKCAVCADGPCTKGRTLRVLAKADKGELRGLLAELGACRAGLTRETLVKATTRLADRSMLGLAWECLQEMGRREMRPSLAAHNKLLDAYARKGRWDLGMRTLLRMQQLGLHHAACSCLQSARAWAHGSACSRKRRPQLEAAARRETQSNAKTADPKRVLLQPWSVRTHAVL